MSELASLPLGAQILSEAELRAILEPRRIPALDVIRDMRLQQQRLAATALCLMDENAALKAQLDKFVKGEGSLDEDADIRAYEALLRRVDEEQSAKG